MVSMKFYKCETCGNIIEMVNDAGVKPVCCGNEMEEVKCNTDDSGAKEKHVPVVKQEGYVLTVLVGEKPHPMSTEHFIEWIEVETNKGSYRKCLKPNDLPSATFVLDKDENFVKAYAYCNIHGLWCV